MDFDRPSDDLLATLRSCATGMRSFPRCLTPSTLLKTASPSPPSSIGRVPSLRRSPSPSRFTGDVVAAIRATFVDNWLDTTGEHPLHLTTTSTASTEATESLPCFVVDAGHSDTRNDIFDHFRILLGAAQERIRLTTAYFVPDPAIVDDLCAAADRGVDVHLLLPGPHTDKNFVRVAARSLMADLVDRGVKISTYQETMLHTKALTIDGSVTSIGSANLNRRSGHHDQEANVVIFDSETTRLLDQHFVDDLEQSAPYAADSVASPGAVQQAFEPVLERLRPWM